MSASIYVITPTTASVTAGGALPLTTIARRQPGCVTQIGSDSANVSVPGYYEVTASVTFTAAAAGDVTIAAFQSGEAIPGIVATETVATPETEVHTVTIHGIVRVRCQEPVSISLVNTGEIAITTTNVALSVIRID